MNLAGMLDEQVRQRGASSAIITGAGKSARRTTFADLDDRSRRAAALLASRGIGPGDRVLVLQGMSATLYECLLALWRVGAAAVFLDPGAGMEHVSACCEMARPAGLVASWRAQLLRLRVPSLDAIPQKFVLGPPFPGTIPWRSSRGMAPVDDLFAATPETPALLTFTSGSTGKPKGALRTHGLLLAQHHAIARALQLTAGDVDLCTLAIFLLANLASGVTSVIPDASLARPGAIDSAPVLEQIVAHRVTQAVASPALIERLIAGAAERPGALAGIARVFTGGAPVSPRLIADMAAAMPNARICPIYGSTEAEPIAHFERAEMSADDVAGMRSGRGLLAGRPVPEITLRIMEDAWGKPAGPWSEAEFQARCVPAGIPGEIVVSGDHVLPGYLNGLGDAETKFRVDGTAWHRTGDAGYLDSAGRLWLLGRCGARVVDGRGTLWPFAVEFAAQEVENVSRAALLQHHGRRLLAIECRKPDRETAELCQSVLAWAALDEVRVMDRIPVDRRHNAKVDYVALQRALR